MVILVQVDRVTVLNANDLAWSKVIAVQEVVLEKETIEIGQLVAFDDARTGFSFDDAMDSIAKVKIAVTWHGIDHRFHRQPTA